MGALGFKIWIFAPKSYLFGGIRVRNQLISAVCLQFALKSLFFNDFFAIIPLFKPLNVSCLFTFSSADCLLYCQLIVYFLSAVCLGELGFKISWFQLIIYIFALKFLFFLDFFLQKCQQLFVYIFSCLFTFSSADCLLFRQLIVYLCQLFVYNLNWFFISLLSK